MTVWSTDDVPAHERFAVWREWRAAHLFGLTADLDPSTRRDFHATIATRAVGTASLVEMKAVPYHARRTVQDITRVRSDSLCIYQQTKGPVWLLRDGRKHAVEVPPFSISIGYSDLPYETIPLSNEAFETRLIRIPLTRDQDPDKLRESMCPRLLRPTPGLDGLLHDYVQAFHRHAAHLEPGAAQAAIETITKLAFLAQAGSNDASRAEGGAEAVAAAKLALVQAYIAENLHRPDLNPTSVARAFSMSVRQLHRLFEPSTTTFARHLLEKRIERASGLLGKPGRRTIIDIAFACGFGGSSAFYRAFKSHFGLCPHDYLKVAADRRTDHPISP